MLHLHRAERADALILPLAALLAVPQEDPFTPDVVAVPTRGVERWLAQRLSHRLGNGPDDDGGICANVEFGSPGRLVREVLSTVLGGDPRDDEWQRDRLTWHLVGVLDRCAGEPWCAALGRHLGVSRTDAGPDDVRRGRRLQAAQHLAGLFSSYAVQRPLMPEAWAADRDDDGAGAPVPTDLAWQPELWRRLRHEIGETSPAESLDEAVARLRSDPGAVELPSRLSVFGPTRLPTAQLRVLHALAVHRDVHLWLPHPSPALWDAVAGALARQPSARAVRRRELVVPATHPLLASMARDATELQLRLAALDGATTTHHPAPEPPATLLGALQRRLRDDAPDVPPEVFDPADRTVQVHACHGRARQVEVLREALIGLFADDPTLEPRDVVVMCPDIEAFAPLVAATFGLAPGDQSGDVHPGRALRVRLADRSLRQTNPLLSLISTLLELADGRVTASQVVDLASAEPVRRRFRLDDDELDRIRAWAAEAGARWGEDVGRRARFGLGDVAQGTWQTALDRILLGVAMAEEDHRYVGSALPLDDVDSTDVDLAGRLTELVDRLTVVLADLDGARPPSDWIDALDLALHLLADVRAADAWQEVEARSVLDDVRHAAVAHAERYTETELRLTDVRALLAGRLRGRPTRAGFRTGALTVCSLEPMRAVPHRVVALLGLDDGAFPRGTGTDGDDILLRDPLVGERDRRGEDRQLFLDAITAAQETLLVLYSGADERTGAARPPAVPVGELLDALDRTATASDGSSVRSHVVVRHPLQTVDERNFTDGALGRRGPFSFDGVNHRAALVGRGQRVGRAPFLTAPLLPAAEEGGTAYVSNAQEVTLDGLIRTLEHPVKTFVRQRLGVLLPGEVDELDDRLPLELDGLEKWQIGDRLLAAALEGVDLPQAIQAEWRRGVVPPRRLGGTVLQGVRDQVVPIAEVAAHHLRGEADTVDVTVALPRGRVLTGTVVGVHGDVLVRAVFSRLAAKHRLRAWVQLLALSAAQPDRAFTAVTVGRPQTRRARAAIAQLAHPDPQDALRWLGELVDLRDQALREPLPLPIATSCAYARSRHAGDEEVVALESARREWKDGYDGTDEQHRLVWGEDVALHDILGTPSPAERTWWPQESTRFGALARRVWEPLLEQERTETV